MEPVNSIQYYLYDPEFEADWPLLELVESGGLERVGTLWDGLEIYKNNRAYPRAFLAAEIEVIPDRDALFARMLSEGYRPDRTVVTQTPPKGELPHATAQNLGSVTMRHYSASNITIGKSDERHSKVRKYPHRFGRPNSLLNAAPPIGPSIMISSGVAMRSGCGKSDSHGCG